ncbi:MAG TPA: hypothetical protein VGO67_11955 [Verrucomicrobiae bacterium]|jgi:hypothetical protein
MKHIQTLLAKTNRFAGRGFAAAGAGLCLASFTARGQQAFQNLMSLDSYKTGQEQAQALPQVYTFKEGDFRLLATPSLELDWNDNILGASSGAEEDFIIMPFLRLTATYPLTDRNVLSLTGGVGYDEYTMHSALSQLAVQAGTGPSFDFVAADFYIDLHDYVSYSQQVNQQPLVAGTGAFGSMNNTAGIRISRDFGKVTLTLGYDYLTTFSTTSQFQSQSEQSELVYSRLAYQLSHSLSAGVELSAALVSYDQAILNNNENYSAGVFATWQPDAAFQIEPHVGYALYQFQQTSQATLVPATYYLGIAPVAIETNGTIQTSDSGSWYANLKVTHTITKTISYNVTAGHEIQGGVESDEVEDWFARLSLNWAVFKNISLSTGLSYEYGNQGVGNVHGNLTESFNFFSGNFSASYAVTKKLDLGLRYNLTIRSSDQAQTSYTQDLMGLVLTYHPS